MSMILCPSCTQQTDADLNFCERCFEQTKCVKCRSTLKKGAPRCLHCGERVVGGDDGDPVRQNTVLVEEKQQQEGDNYISFRRLSVSLNDKAVPALGGLLATGVSGLGADVRIAPKQVKRIPKDLPKPGESEPLLDYVPETDGRAEDVKQNPESADVPTIAEPVLASTSRSGLDIKTVFMKNDDDRIVLRTKDFKGHSKKNQQMRFIVLFTMAMGEIVGNAVTRAQLNSTARDAGLYDAKLGSYVTEATSTYFLKAGGEAYRLNMEGEQFVAQILNDMADEAITETYNYWTPGPKQSRPRAPMDGKSVQEVESWLAMQSKFDDMDVRFIDQNNVHVVFAVWLVTRGLEFTKAVSSTACFAFYKRKFETVAISKQQFSKEIGRDSMRRFIDKTEDGLYFALPTADDMIGKLLEQQNIIHPYRM